MKKIYLEPELEVVYLKMQQTLLAGSPYGPDIMGDSSDPSVTNEGDILAPSLPGVPGAPGLPGMPSLFE